MNFPLIFRGDLDVRNEYGEAEKTADLFPESVKAKAAPKPRPAPPDKPLDGALTKTELTRSLSVIYNNRVHRPLHDPIRYDRADFEEEADGLIELMQQHAALRVVLRILVPLAGFAALYEKLEGTFGRWRERQAIQKREKAARQEAYKAATSPSGPTAEPGTSGSNGVPGLTAEQIKNRPFGR